jgi:hypothetical protein
MGWYRWQVRVYIVYIKHIIQQHPMHRLSVEARTLLEQYGSEKINQFKAGTSFVMVGQRALVKGSALDAISQTTERDFDAVATLSGCVKVPSEW